MVELKPKDYAFLKVLFEAEDCKLTTSQIRKATDPKFTVNSVEVKSSDFVTLDNSDVNYRVAKFGDGNSQLSGKNIVSIEHRSDDAGRSLPKVIQIRKERIDEIGRLLDEYNPNASVEDFSSYQEAMNYYIERMDEARSQVDSNESKIDELEATVRELKEERAGMSARLEKVESQVDTHEDSIMVLDNRVRPLVLGMAELLEEKMGFNPANYFKD